MPLVINTPSHSYPGGYLAGKKYLMDYIRFNSHSSVYAESITPPVLQQIHTSMSIIMGNICGDDGRLRIATLAQNAKYFRDSLRSMGFIVYGNDSPVIPLLLFHPAKIPAFSRELVCCFWFSVFIFSWIVELRLLWLGIQQHRLLRVVSGFA